MGLRGRSKRPPGPAASGADLISGLADDVLVRVLEFLPETRDAIRTGALSRRWRGLWTRLPALRFQSSGLMPPFKGAGGRERYIAFVNDALAHRAARDDGAALEHLAISFSAHPLAFGRLIIELDAENHLDVRPAIEAARGWIRHATRQLALKSFVLELNLPAWYDGGRAANAMTLDDDDLRSSAKLETMRLALNGAAVRLPAAAVFVSLTDLSLENMQLTAPCGLLRLNRFLSSACCPQLRKLRLKNLWPYGEKQKLLIEADVLVELSLEEMCDWYLLELRTRSLRVLRFCSESDCFDTLKIAAPRLEELKFIQKGRPELIEIDGELPCMTRLKVQLCSHDGFECDNTRINDTSVQLLQCCTSATHLDVSLEVMKREEQAFAPDIIKGRIPQLPHVKCLTVHVDLRDLHSFGVGIGDILKQCKNLECLRVQCLMQAIPHISLLEDSHPPEWHSFLCNHPDPWQSHEISLAHLQKVEFTRLAGTDCEMWFLQSVLSSATQLQKVTVSFDSMYRLKDRRDCFERIPQLEGGVWNACNDTNLSYEWMPNL